MLTLLGAGQGQNSSFDADYQAVLNRATALNYALPTAPQQIIQNNLVLALKAGGIWTELDVLYIFANDATNGFNFGSLNWKNPNLYQSNPNNPITFTANQGFTGQGVGSFIDTNFNPFLNGVKYQQNNASRYVYMFQANGTESLDGVASSTANNMRRISTPSQRINQGSTQLNSSFDFSATRGMKSIHRTSATNVELFNATTQGSRTATSDTVASLNQLILRLGSSYGLHTVSMYAMGASLVAKNTVFVTAFDNYINSL